MLVQSSGQKLWQNVKILFIITVWIVSALSQYARSDNQKWIYADKKE